MDTGLRTKTGEVVLFHPKILKEEQLRQHKDGLFKYMQIIFDEWENKKNIPIKNPLNISQEHISTIVKLTPTNKNDYIDLLREKNYQELAHYFNLFFLPSNKINKNEGSRYYFFMLCKQISLLFKDKFTDKGEKTNAGYCHQITKFFISNYLITQELEPKNVQVLQPRARPFYSTSTYPKDQDVEPKNVLKPKNVQEFQPKARPLEKIEIKKNVSPSLQIKSQRARIDTGIKNKQDEPIFFESKIYDKEQLNYHKNEFYKFMTGIFADWEKTLNIPIKNPTSISQEQIIKIMKLTKNSISHYIGCLEDKSYNELDAYFFKFMAQNHKVSKNEGPRTDFFGLYFRIKDLYKKKVSGQGVALHTEYYNQLSRYFVTSYMRSQGLEPKNVQVLQPKARAMPLFENIESKESIPPFLQTKSHLVRWHSGRENDNSNCIGTIRSSYEINVSPKTAKLLDFVTEEIKEEFLKLNLMMTNKVAKEYGTLEKIIESKISNYVAIQLSKEKENEINKKYKVSLVTAFEGEVAVLVAFLQDTIKFIGKHKDSNKEHNELDQKNEKYRKITMFFAGDTIRRLWTDNDIDKFSSSYRIPYQIDKFSNEVLAKKLNNSNLIAASCSYHTVRNVMSRLWTQKTSPHISEIYEEMKKEL